jgi:hypothetical protein
MARLLLACLPTNRDRSEGGTPQGSSPRFILATLCRSTGQPGSRRGSRDQPKFRAHHSPNCGLSCMTSRYFALPAVPRREYQPGNNAGACHPTNMKLPARRQNCNCHRDTHHGLDLDPHDRFQSRSQPCSRDQPRRPCRPSPNCILPGRQIRCAAALAEPGPPRLPNNSAACRRRTSTKSFVRRCAERKSPARPQSVRSELCSLC